MSTPLLVRIFSVLVFLSFTYDRLTAEIFCRIREVFYNRKPRFMSMVITITNTAVTNHFISISKPYFEITAFLTKEKFYTHQCWWRRQRKRILILSVFRRLFCVKIARSDIGNDSTLSRAFWQLNERLSSRRVVSQAYRWFCRKPSSQRARDTADWATVNCGAEWASDGQCAAAWREGTTVKSIDDVRTGHAATHRQCSTSHRRRLPQYPCQTQRLNHRPTQYQARRRKGGGGQEAIAPLPWILVCEKVFFFGGHFLSKIQNFGLEILHFGTILGRNWNFEHPWSSSSEICNFLPPPPTFITQLRIDFRSK